MTAASLQIYPRFVTRGGKVLIRFPFDKDPFKYQVSDFMVDHVPLRSIYMTNRTFCGEVSSLMESKEHILSIRDSETQKNFQIPLRMPEIATGSFYQLENNVFFNKRGNLLFLDIQKSPKNDNQYIPVLCHYNVSTEEKKNIPLSDPSINAIFVDLENNVFATSIQEKTLFKIGEKFELIPYARGLGSPFGMVCNANNELFMADQKGSLFRIEDHRAIFLGDIPPSLKGYYLAVCPQNQNIYISTPNYLGENVISIFEYKSQKLKQQHSTYNLLGPVAFDKRGSFYWVENAREESIIYRQHKKKIEKFLSGHFFTGLNFNKNGDMYVNDLHNIYKIKKDTLYD